MKRLILCLIVGCLSGIMGCGQRASVDPAQAQASADELVKQWHELAKADVNKLDVVSAATITQRLAVAGPAGLQPIFDALGDPEGSPKTKLLAVISLTPLISEDWAPLLIELTLEGQETTTRACATHLLGLLDGAEAKARMDKLVLDPEHRVKVAAISVRVVRGDTTALEAVPELWENPETSDNDRDQMALMITESHLKEHLQVYASGILMVDLEPRARQHLATLLGRVGDANVIPLLEQCAAQDPDEGVRTMAASAADALKARLAQEEESVPGNGVLPEEEPGNPVEAEENTAEATQETTR